MEAREVTDVDVCHGEGGKLDDVIEKGGLVMDMRPIFLDMIPCSINIVVFEFLNELGRVWDPFDDVFSALSTIPRGVDADACGATNSPRDGIYIIGIV